MTSRTRSRKVISAAIRGSEDSDEGASLKDKGSELFVDPIQGNPLVCYVHEEVEDRSEVVKLIRIHGGGTSSTYTNATYILVDPLTVAGQNLKVLFDRTKKSKTVLDARWIRKCVDAGKILAYKFEWAGCLVTGKERDEYLSRRQEEARQVSEKQEIPSLDTAMHGSDSTSDEEREELQEDPTNARGETPTQKQHDDSSQPSSSVAGSGAGAGEAQPDEGDAGRPLPPPMFYPTHPMMYSYTPGRPGAPMPMPWPYMPNGVPMPMPMPLPMPMPMFAPPSPGTQPEVPGGQSIAPIPPNYTAYDYQQAQAFSNTWMEYYAHMDPAVYARQLEEASAYQYQSYPPVESPETEKRSRGRTRTRHAGPNLTKLSIKATGPPVRSPSPPTKVVRSTYGGNLFTEDDIQYLKHYIDYCQDQGLLLSLREICERLAIRAPHHTFFSWRRYCNKHQIRLGAYTMEDRNDSTTPMDEDGTIQVEGTSGGTGAGSSSTPVTGTGNKNPRTGSPIAPKILYKSTTGKGVAFTPEDVQYLLDYMEYRSSKSVEPLDMVEFWNDLAEKAPHHSRASWMKYWRRHRHELVPNGNQPVAPAYVAPPKKSRYTNKDDILLAKYFMEKSNNTDGPSKKTSDVVFQEFAALHAHHPWKGWQEHYRLHKSQIDQLIKRMVAGEEVV